MLPKISKDLDFASSPISSANFYTNFSVVSGEAKNSAADNTLCILGADTPSTAQVVLGTFKVQDGVGLFCSSSDTSSGVFFTIEYNGTETLFKLRMKDPSITKLSDTNMTYFAEAPMPPSMSRGTEYRFSLTVGSYGWNLSYQRSGVDYTLLQLPYASVPSSNPEGSLSSALRSASSLKAGFYTYKQNTTCRLLKVYHIGYQYNPMLSITTLFQDGFSGVSQWYNPTTADVQPSGTYLLNPGTYPVASGIARDGSGQLSVTGTTPVQFLGGFASNGPVQSDQPLTMISFKYVSGQLAIGLLIGGATKNVYINSDIQSAGTFKAITVETGGP